MALFQDELDEPNPFQDEPDETDEAELFRVEEDEPELAPARSDPVPVRPGPMCFGDEPDEESDNFASGSDSDYLADVEDAGGVKQLVDLSFSTLQKFLASELCKNRTSSMAPPPKKKRCYNNANRAARAAARHKPREGPQRVQRNDPVA